ncbi:ATP-binding protein, partial [Gammaproteobacteria bacterium]|nr:ATP-binding protein [Gammaproteobacteria bacterium]
MKDLKLDLSDFSSHDSMGDMLMALQLQKQTFSDLQEYGVMLDKKKTQLEEAIKLLDISEKSLQTLLDSTGLGILMTDLNGNINIWNEGVQNITGIKIDDYDKKNLCDLFQLEGIYDNQNLISGQRYETKIIITNDKVNENIIKLTISPITDLNNSVKSYCHVFRDITDELKLESIMRENEKSMAVSLLTGQIAHQINDLLKGIHTNVDEAIDYIAADLVKDETGSIKTILKNIDEQSTLISKITNSMLAFSGQQYLSKKNYDINELIYNVIHQDDYQDIDKSIITLNLSHLPLIMEGDKKAFPTCLINILKNSSEALVNTKSPSIKIDTYVALEQELIDENIKTSDYICIRIKDNGKGIKTDNLNLIFDPFYTTKIKTTQGMGLSFVQGYIRQIGG